MKVNACPCGRTGPQGQLAYEACCGLAHAGERPAPDAETLMRSRYSAFVRGDVPYLLTTWHASHRPATLELEAGAKWLGLDVKSATHDGDRGTVHFVARCRNAGKGQRLEETSRFVREDGLWFYVDGDFEKQ